MVEQYACSFRKIYPTIIFSNHTACTCQLKLIHLLAVVHVDCIIMDICSHVCLPAFLCLNHMKTVLIKPTSLVWFFCHVFIIEYNPKTTFNSSSILPIAKTVEVSLFLVSSLQVLKKKSMSAVMIHCPSRK